MHEMALAESVLGIVEKGARSAGLRSVTAVRLEIGSLAAVEPEALRFCFGAVVKGSVADGARLDILELPATAWCMRCCRSVQVASRAADCPACGSSQLQVSGGDDLRVKELEGF